MGDAYISKIDQYSKCFLGWLKTVKWIADYSLLHVLGVGSADCGKLRVFLTVLDYRDWTLFGKSLGRYIWQNKKKSKQVLLVETKCCASLSTPLVTWGEENDDQYTYLTKESKFQVFSSPSRSDVVFESPKNVYSMKDRGTQRN